MADENVLRIEIEDDSRANPLLDEAFKGGASPPPLPTAGKTVGGPNFPTTVMGPDGKQYSAEAYLAAQRKFQGQQRAAEAGEAYDNLFGPPGLPPPLPKKEAGGGGGFLDQLLKQFGGGQLAKAFGGEAAGAAGAAGGAGALAAGAATGGIAIAAVMAIDRVTGSLQTMKRAVDGITDAATGLAENKLPDLNAAAEGAADALGSSIPIVGDMLASVIKLDVAVAGIPKKIEDAFLQRAKELAPVSGPISSAEIRAEVRTLKADIREANELGPSLGKMIDAQNRIEVQFRELLLPIKRFLLEVLAPIMEKGATLIEIAANFPTLVETLIGEATGAIVLAITGEWTKAGEKLDKLPKKLADVLKKDEDGEDLYNQFIRDLDQSSPGPGGGVAGSVGFLAGLGIG